MRVFANGYAGRSCRISNFGNKIVERQYAAFALLQYAAFALLQYAAFARMTHSYV